jgi:pilus assembly protein CpaE
VSGVTLVSEDQAFADRVTAALGLSEAVRRIWDDWPTLSAAVDDALVSDPDVVVIGPGFDNVEDQLDLVSALEARRADVALIAVGPPDGAFVMAAMRAGARDLIDPGAGDAHLSEILQRARAVVDRRRSALAQADERVQRRVITVLSPKGGTGKTTVSTNLAVGLAQAAIGPVLLIDLDLQFGDVSGALGLEPEHSIADATRSLTLDRTSLKMLLTHHSSGLYVLTPPENLAEADDITGDQLKKMFALLVDEFPWIVVDTSAGIDEASIVALEFATDLLFVGSTDVPAVRAVKRQVAALDRLAMTTQARHLVLNRSDARVGLETDDISLTVGLPVSHQIPSSRAIPISTNQGSPVIESNHRDSVTRAFTALVESFLPEESRQSTDRRRWRR